LKFSSLQSVDASEDIGVPVDRVDTISLSRGDEGEMNSDSPSSCVGACEQTVLSHEDPGFYRPLGLVVIDSNFGILEKTGQGNPVLERVVDCLCEFVSRGEFRLGAWFIRTRSLISLLRWPEKIGYED